jgi:hypothetical protein
MEPIYLRLNLLTSSVEDYIMRRQNELIYNSIWFIATLALLFAIMTVAIDARAQDDPTPTPTATLSEDELITCWWEGDTYICIAPPVAVTATPTNTPVPPPTMTPTATPAAYAYMPIVIADVVVTGDVR